MSVAINCYLRRIKLTKDGYEHGPCGKYHGVGRPVYRLDLKETDFWQTRYFRAKDREDAKERVRALYPKAIFFS